MYGNSDYMRQDGSKLAYLKGTSFLELEYQLFESKCAYSPRWIILTHQNVYHHNHQLYMITRPWLVKTSIEVYWLIINQYTTKFVNAMTSITCFIRRQTMKKTLKNVTNTLCHLMISKSNRMFRRQLTINHS